MKEKLQFTLKAWLGLTIITLVICFLTEEVAKLFGVELPDQANIKLVRDMAGWNWRFVFLCVQVIVIMPVVEEFVFRYLLYKLPSLKLKKEMLFASISAVLFSSAHYLFQPFPDSAMIALVFFGLAQCWIYKKAKAIWSPMITHGLFNTVNLILLFFVTES